MIRKLLSVLNKQAKNKISATSSFLQNSVFSSPKRNNMLRWFPDLFGFQEYQIEAGEIQPSRNNYLKTQESFEIINSKQIKSIPNGRVFTMGEFSTPTLHELRQEVADYVSTKCSGIECISISTEGERAISFEHLPITDILKMHSEHPGATFQAASQFNCLEFGSPHVTPEYGVACYAYDETQGPACALACAAGTIFRNYFVAMDRGHGDNSGEGKSCGQTEESQLNNLDNLEILLDNKKEKYWEIRNGYSFSDVDSLNRLNECLDSKWSAEHLRDFLRVSIKVGVQDGVGVTFSRRFESFDAETPEILVNQVYCSALSCGYAGMDNTLWEPLARLILEASYEATLLAAVRSQIKQQDATRPPDIERHRVFLTFLGGGVFRNESSWIGNAIGSALARVECLLSSNNSGVKLHVVICHYRRLNAQMCEIINVSYRDTLEALQSH